MEMARRAQYAILVSEEELAEFLHDPRKLATAIEQAKASLDNETSQARVLKLMPTTKAPAVDDVKVLCPYCQRGFAARGLNTHIVRAHPSRRKMLLPGRNV